MNLQISADAEHLLERLKAFMQAEVYPRELPITKSWRAPRIASRPSKPWIF